MRRFGPIWANWSGWVRTGAVRVRVCWARETRTGITRETWSRRARVREVHRVVVVVGVVVVRERIDPIYRVNDGRCGDFDADFAVHGLVGVGGLAGVIVCYSPVIWTSLD